VVLALASIACELVGKNKDPYSTDKITMVKDFSTRAPANLAILPVESVDSMDATGRDRLRDLCYDLFMQKGYAPLSTSFVDKTLREMGKTHTPIARDKVWNTEPFKDLMATYADALVFVSIERYLESGKPDQSGIIVWGKVAIFDSLSMELLFEHFTRQTLHPTDPGGGRELFIRKALEEFTQLLLRPLPERGAAR
jgi:hypothetical protein